MSTVIAKVSSIQSSPDLLTPLKDNPNNKTCCTVEAEVDVTYSNAGNTPAYGVSVLNSEAWLPAGLVIPPKNSITVHASIVLQLQDLRTARYWINCTDCTMDLGGSLLYDDIFGEHHKEPLVLVFDTRLLSDQMRESVRKSLSKFREAH